MSMASKHALRLELKKLNEEPVEGFQVHPREDNITEWDIIIFGPPKTLYEGGYFKAIMRFPTDYPFSPPSLKFVTKVFHPNVYENGEVCISILHPPINDEMAGELPEERWTPSQTVRTILLSVISLLNEPNTFSPANVDASVMYRRWVEAKDKKYEEIILQQVNASKQQAKEDNVVIPLTEQDYCLSSKQVRSPDRVDQVIDSTELFDYIIDDYDSDDDDES